MSTGCQLRANCQTKPQVLMAGQANLRKAPSFKRGEAEDPPPTPLTWRQPKLEVTLLLADLFRTLYPIRPQDGDLGGEKRDLLFITAVITLISFRSQWLLKLGVWVTSGGSTMLIRPTTGLNYPPKRKKSQIIILRHLLDLYMVDHHKIIKIFLSTGFSSKF